MEEDREGEIIRFAVSYMMYLSGNEVAFRTDNLSYWVVILMPVEVHHVFRANIGEATVEIPGIPQPAERQTLIGLSRNVDVTFHVGGEFVTILVDPANAKALRMMAKK